MFKARLMHENGADELIGTNSYEPAILKSYAGQGRLCCPTCAAKLSFVEADIVDGGISREAFFRSNRISDHDADCAYRNDPHESAQILSFKKALLSGQKILLNINISPTLLGIKGLHAAFNLYSHTQGPDLYLKKNWVRETGKSNYTPTSIHDVQELIAHLHITKDIGGQETLQRLWFNTGGIVQSARRFVVADKPQKLGPLLGQMAARAKRQTYRNTIDETPRLFKFEIGHTERAEGAGNKPLHLLWAEQVEVDVPCKHILVSGIRLGRNADEPPLERAHLFEGGQSLWVLATPSISRARACDIADKASGRMRGSVKPAFLMLPIKTRAQYTPA